MLFFENSLKNLTTRNIFPYIFSKYFYCSSTFHLVRTEQNSCVLTKAKIWVYLCQLTTKETIMAKNTNLGFRHGPEPPEVRKDQAQLLTSSEPDQRSQHSHIPICHKMEMYYYLTKHLETLKMGLGQEYWIISLILFVVTCMIIVSLASFRVINHYQRQFNQFWYRDFYFILCFILAIYLLIQRYNKHAFYDECNNNTTKRI